MLCDLFAQISFFPMPEQLKAEEVEDFVMAPSSTSGPPLAPAWANTTKAQSS